MIDRSDEVPHTTEVSTKETKQRQRAGKVTSINKLPTVIVGNRQDRDVVADYLSAIRAKNETSPFVFAYGDRYVRIRRDVTGRITFDPITVDVLMNIMSGVANTITLNDGKPCAVSVSKHLATMILNEPECLFPPVQGIRYIPFYRVDGTFCTTPGYDVLSQYYYDPIDEKSFAAIPSSQEAAAAAAAHFFDLVGEFPFVSDADRANYLALAITMIIQGSFQGKAAAAIIDAISDAGSGKGFLTNIIHIIATGNRFAAQDMPEDNPAWRKMLTAYAIQGDPILVIDNIRGVVNSTALESFITESIYTDRLLSTNKTVRVPNNTITVLNGNNVQLGKDMPSRCYFIRLDAKTSRAYLRDGYKIPDILGYITEHRQEYLMDLLTIVKSWHAAGRPMVAKTVYDGRFPAWSGMIANILKYAGVDHVFENALTDIVSSDNEQEEWAGWLEIMHNTYGDEVIRVSDLANHIMAPGDNRDIVDGMPSALAMGLDSMRSTTAASTRIGHYLRVRKGRRYGESQFMLEDAGKDRTNKTLWRVVIGKPHAISPLADEPPVTHVDITQSVFQEVEDAEQQPTRPSIPNNRPTQTPATPVIHPTACATCGSGTLYAISPRRDVWACNNPACSEWRNPRDIRNKIGYDE